MNQRGEANHNAKATEAEVKKICWLLENALQLSMPDIAVKVGTSLGVVRGIYQGRNWPWISGRYNFSVRVAEGLKRKSNARWSDPQLL